MQPETATVKKVIKKYKTKDGAEKESISYNAKLTADSEFKDGDIVAVIPIDELDAIGDADEIQNLKDIVADKDATIDELNESNAKLNAELQNKFNLINDVTAKLKASEKTVDDLKSDISEKDDIIAELHSDIKVANSKNDELHKKLDELNDLLTGKDETIAELDATIVDYKIKIAEFNAVDVDKLKEKADKLDAVKDDLIDVTNRLDSKSNVISLLQNQIMELQQLLKFKDNKIDRLENKGALDYILKRDVTADIDSPTLFLIDPSGNLIKENPDIEVDASDVADDDHDNNESGKDRIYKI